jgi:hypothetical protein
MQASETGHEKQPVAGSDSTFFAVSCCSLYAGSASAIVYDQRITFALAFTARLARPMKEVIFDAVAKLVLIANRS